MVKGWGGFVGGFGFILCGQKFIYEKKKSVEGSSFLHGCVFRLNFRTVH